MWGFVNRVSDHIVCFGLQGNPNHNIVNIANPSLTYSSPLKNKNILHNARKNYHEAEISKRTLELGRANAEAEAEELASQSSSPSKSPGGVMA